MPEVSPLSKDIFEKRRIPDRDSLDRDPSLGPSSYNSSHVLSLLEEPKCRDRQSESLHGTSLLEKPDTEEDSKYQVCDDANADLSVEESEPEKIDVRQWVYHVVDSWAVGLIAVIVVAADCVFFFIGFLGLLEEMAVNKLMQGYRVMDWITVAVYTIEVGARLYAYGVVFYFQSVLRFMDVLVIALNFPAVIALAIFDYEWLKACRFLRLIRAITVPILTRERELKWQAREELEELVLLLDKERSEENRLTKWKIDADAIAQGESMGNGSFGEVFLGLFRGTLVAVKQLYHASQYQEEEYSIEDEAVTLVNLRHPNVVLFMGFVHEPDKLWIVTEYCSRGSLQDLLKDPNIKLNENRVLRFALGAIRGLAYLHGQDPPVLHLDLKASNILVSSGWDTKLADFGLSKRIDALENSTFAGTTHYSAPEILEHNQFSEKADIYSFGICLWELAARQEPFENLAVTEVLFGVVKRELRPDVALLRTGSSERPLRQGHALPNLYDAKSLTLSLRVDSPENSPMKRKMINARQRGKDEFAEELKESNSSAAYAEAQSADGPIPPPSKTAPRLPKSVANDIQSPRPAELLNSLSPRAAASPKHWDRTDHELLPSFKAGAEASSPSKRGRGGRPIETMRRTLSRSTPRQSILTSPLSPRASKVRQPNSFVTTSANALFSSPREKSRKQQSLDFTNRVVEKLDLFEDRPYVARKSLRETRRLSSSSSEATNSRSQSRRKSGRQSTTQTIHSDGQIHSNGEQSIPLVGPRVKREDSFTRRLASFKAKQRLVDKSLRESSRSSSKTSKQQQNESPSVKMSDEYINLIKRCWAQDPAMRPEANEIVWKLVGLIDNHLRQENGSSGIHSS